MEEAQETARERTGPHARTLAPFQGLDLATEPFGGTIPTYLDTLHSDYAFIITIAPFVKSMEFLPDSGWTNEGWDFALYPNPAQGSVYLRFEDDAPKNVRIVDLAGRVLVQRHGVTAVLNHVSVEHLAKGIYWVQVSDGSNSRTKKLVVQ